MVMEEMMTMGRRVWWGKQAGDDHHDLGVPVHVHVHDANDGNEGDDYEEEGLVGDTSR